MVLTFEAEGQRLVVFLDPEIGYRYRRWERIAPNGRLIEERSAEFYQTVNGIPFPFKHETTKYRADGSKYYHERLVVLAADFNVPQNAVDLSLDIPGTAMVTDLVQGGRVLKVRTPRRLGVDDLRGLSRELEHELAAEKPIGPSSRPTVQQPEGIQLPSR